MESSLIIVSNRLPVTVSLGGTAAAPYTLEPSSGGLVTALSSLDVASRSWIGWPGTEVPPALQAGIRKSLHETHGSIPVFVDSRQIDRYYNGFSNGVVWPLFHYLTDDTAYTQEDWDAYRQVNEQFADVVAEHAGPNTSVWIHDYQLMLLPQMLRARVPSARIGFFLHIPFPSSEVYRLLPVRSEVLEGLLGADVIGFHTYGYLRHFSSACQRILGLDARPDAVRSGERDVKLSVNPIGIDPEQFRSQARDAVTQTELARLREHYTGRRILLGIDRMDYSKGLRHKMKAFARFLERFPEDAGHVLLMQVAVPSRTDVEEYQILGKEVEELVGHINGMYGRLGHTPVQFHFRSVSPAELSALYQLADVCLLTPIRDGMNLVCQEYAVSREDDNGVLILSEFAGAAGLLEGALLVNPWNYDEVAEAIHVALHMPAEERHGRMRRMKKRVWGNTVASWARRFVASIHERPSEIDNVGERSLLGHLPDLLLDFEKRPRRYLLLDYDGTLRPFTPTPSEAVPSTELRALLADLAGLPGTKVYIVSGRPMKVLEEWLGDLPIGLCAEHGLFLCEAGSERWESLVEISADWMEFVEDIMDGFAANTPGSLVETKTAALAWHWRRTDPDFGQWQANELAVHLHQALANLPVEVLAGHKVIEVRAQGVNKGTLARHLGKEWVPSDFVLALGDDETDEDLFEQLPPAAWSARVGRTSAHARYLVEDSARVLDLLRRLVEQAARPV